MSLECHPFALLDAVMIEAASLPYRIIAVSNQGYWARLNPHEDIRAAGVRIVGNDMADDRTETSIF
jgi:hypothetical protein